MRDNRKKKRDNRSEKGYVDVRTRVVNDGLVQMATRPEKAAQEFAQSANTLQMNALETIAKNYLRSLNTEGGETKVDAAFNLIPRVHKKGPKKGQPIPEIIRNRFSAALAQGKTRAKNAKNELRDIGLVLVPYAGPINPAGGSGGSRNVAPGATTTNLLMSALSDSKVLTGVSQGGGSKDTWVLADHDHAPAGGVN
jgi:hypothetical protein